MRAIVVNEFGDSDVLVEVERPAPRPERGQVTIDVSCASVTLADVLMRRGEFGGSPPLIPGLEAAGTVREVGPGVGGLSPGDAVVTLSRPTAGGYAEVTVAEAEAVVAIGDLDPAIAVAAVPNATTAILALTAVAHLSSGDDVLVHGSLGALGAIVGQVARSLGAATVDATVRRSAQMERASRAGYDHVILTDPSAPDLWGDRRYDIILDPVGGDLRRTSLDLLRPLGRMVVLGNASGEDVAVDTTRLWLDGTAVAGLNAGALLAGNPSLGIEPGRRAVELIRSGAIRVDIEPMPLSAARDAHRLLEQGDLTRRLVLVP